VGAGDRAGRVRAGGAEGEGATGMTGAAQASVVPILSQLLASNDLGSR